MLTRKSILNKTNYGLNIYSYILKQYYKDETVLSVSGRDCQPTKNPFNNDKPTLLIKIAKDCAIHSDAEGAIEPGDAFDFASLFFGLSGQDLINKLNEALFLRIDQGATFSAQVRGHHEGSQASIIKEEWPVFSYFTKPITNITPSFKTDLLEVYNFIKGDRYYKNTDTLRKKKDVNDAKKYKKKSFDYVTFSGTFSKRHDSNLEKHSGLIVLDFDHVKDITMLKTALLKDVYFETELLFVSPSGDGLKWVISIDLKQADQHVYFKGLENYFKQTYNIEFDPGKEVSRACFLPHDPHVYIKPKDLKAKKKKKFIPQNWIDEPIRQIGNLAQQQRDLISDTTDVESVIQRIEADRVDITATYSDWINIGFCFADEFGENGRNFFHRVSQFYPDYSAPECDKQFENCLKSKGRGITMKTFFHLAKEAGIDIAPPRKERQDHRTFIGEKPNENQSNRQLVENQESEQMPTFPATLFPELPLLLQKAVKIATSNEERDILLLGSLVAISACLPKISGIYDGKRVYSNLFLFVTAQASAGKGRLVHCRQLVNPIHKELREQAKLLRQHYELELAEYNANKGKVEGAEKPAKPPEKMLFIPANNSSTGAYQLLGDSDGKGLIFETEGDTLAHAFKSDYGNYSDGFRKAFHHETISYYRRTDREYVDIDSPRLSTVLSGTPNQVAALIPNAENGLFSRFIFYYMNVRPEWKNVFASQITNGLDDYFDTLGNEFFSLYSSLKAGKDIQFILTADQEKQFNQFFGQIQEKYISIQGIDYMATIRRLGLIAYRFCMIFSALRITETGETSTTMICEERDFQSSLAIVKVLVKHSSKVFVELPEDVQKPSRLNRKEKFLNGLPMHFNRQKYLEVASALRIPAKTAEGYITSFRKANLIHRDYNNNYTNTSLEETQDSKETKDE